MSKPTIGDYVIATKVPGLPEYDGHACRVTRIDGGLTYGEFRSNSKPDDTLLLSFVEWKPFPTPRVVEGNRIRAINVPSVPHANGRDAIVTRMYDGGGLSNPVSGHMRDMPYILADFEAYHDEDGIFREATNWCVWEWEISDHVDDITWENRDRLIGKTVRALEVSGYHECEGQTFTVDSVHASSNTRWTKGIAVQGHMNCLGNTRLLWATRWELAEEAPNLAADDYAPTPGDEVKMTGYIDEDGIKDGLDLIGRVSSVDGDVWCVAVAGVIYVSGPGYVFPVIEAVEEAPITKADYENALARITRLEERNATLMQSVDDWTHDFDLYAEKVSEEAIERGWCEEYESVMGRVQRALRVATIPERAKPRVQVSRRVRAEVWRDVQVWVDEDNQYTTDTDEMYDESDSEYALGDEWATTVIEDEIQNIGGFDTLEVTTR